MRHITVLLKPTEECNLRCAYCYHADTGYVKGKMSIDFFEEIIHKIVESYNKITLIFHGGEPLLMGYDFYKRAFSIINKYKQNGIQWILGIQTNGYFLDECFCKLFESNNIIPSISFDGPGTMNILRDQTTRITENIVKLRKKGHPINLLGVITKKNMDLIEDYYFFAKENGCPLKLNPVFEEGGAKYDNDYIITPDEYIDVIKRLLPIWLDDESANTLFDPLSTILYMVITNKHGLVCDHCGCLSNWISINHDGTLYPCTRSYPACYCLGNIKDINKLEEAFLCENFKQLLIGSIERRNQCRNNCEYYSVCLGGCNNDAIAKGDITKPDGFKCKVYREIFPHFKQYLQNNSLAIKNKIVLNFMRNNSYEQYNDK